MTKKIQNKSSKLLKLVIPYKPFEMGKNEQQKKGFSNLLRYITVYLVLEIFNSQKPFCSYLCLFDGIAFNYFQH